MRYSTTSELTNKICKEIGWQCGMKALETAKRKEQVHIKGTALKPDEAWKLESFCAKNGYKYHGPFAS